MKIVQNPKVSTKNFFRNNLKFNRLFIPFFFLLSQICISQNSEESKLMIAGEKAFLENNFLLAKDIYTKAIKIDPSNKNYWYNLATSELQLGDKENACEHFYQAFILNDGEALAVIKENCPNFRDGTIMSINDVEEKPKFIYNGKEFFFIEKNAINEKFLSLLYSKFKNSKILLQKNISKVYIQLTINKYDSADVKILKIIGDEKEAALAKEEILSIFKNLVIYVSAKNKGINVDLWEKWNLPIAF
ncbi:tetratricopeptide repeat protein [Flavobacterium sp. FlaQc-57]|uniref:tetratricopeptide repeat protein n=1 Tax=Flavobacterium sp. FlaQc-57 TaxID=3374186 RepID=UPI003756A762